MPWAFVFAAGVLAVAALVAAVPGGAMARADRHATERLRRALATAGLNDWAGNCIPPGGMFGACR